MDPQRESQRNVRTCMAFATVGLLIAAALVFGLSVYDIDRAVVSSAGEAIGLTTRASSIWYAAIHLRGPARFVSAANSTSTTTADECSSRWTTQPVVDSWQTLVHPVTGISRVSYAFLASRPPGVVRVDLFNAADVKIATSTAISGMFVVANLTRVQLTGNGTATLNISHPYRTLYGSIHIDVHLVVPWQTSPFAFAVAAISNGTCVQDADVMVIYEWRRGIVLTLLAACVLFVLVMLAISSAAFDRSNAAVTASHVCVPTIELAKVHY